MVAPTVHHAVRVSASPKRAIRGRVRTLHPRAGRSVWCGRARAAASMRVVRVCVGWIWQSFEREWSAAESAASADGSSESVEVDERTFASFAPLSHSHRNDDDDALDHSSRCSHSEHWQERRGSTALNALPACATPTLARSTPAPPALLATYGEIQGLLGAGSYGGRQRGVLALGWTQICVGEPLFPLHPDKSASFSSSFTSQEAGSAGQLLPSDEA